MLKRSFDFLSAIVGLILLSPIFILVACWIKIDSDGSVFFRQVRVGLDGSSFRIHKFRTMCINSEKKGKLTIGNDDRITRPGHFLRKYKIDELPQLIDVLLGKMSLVGPRPELKKFIDQYPNDIKHKVLSMRPGITDMASIEMVNESEILGKYENATQAYVDIILPIKQKYYLEYVDNHNMWIDLKIIILTLKKIVLR